MDVLIKPFHSGSGNYEEEEINIFKDSVRMEDTKEIRPSRHNRVDAHMNSWRLWQHAMGLYKFKTNGFPVLNRGIDKKLPLFEICRQG